MQEAFTAVFSPRRRFFHVAFSLLPLVMILAASTPNAPNDPHVSSSVVGVLCGMFCEVIFIRRLAAFTYLVQSITSVLPIAHGYFHLVAEPFPLPPSTRSVVERQGCDLFFSECVFSRSSTSPAHWTYDGTDPPHSTRPFVGAPNVTPLAPIFIYPFQRQRGPDSVDTLPPYTPSEGPSPSSSECTSSAVV